MTALIPTPTVDGSAGQEQHVAEAQRAAAAFLARSNPAQYVRRPKVHPNDARGLDRSELGAFLFAADRVGHPHRTLRIVGKGNKPAVVPLVPGTARTIDLQSGNVSLGRSCSATTAAALTGALPKCRSSPAMLILERPPSTTTGARALTACGARRGRLRGGWMICPPAEP